MSAIDSTIGCGWERFANKKKTQALPLNAMTYGIRGLNAHGILAVHARGRAGQGSSRPWVAPAAEPCAYVHVLHAHGRSLSQLIVEQDERCALHVVDHQHQLAERRLQRESLGALHRDCARCAT
jgi:hypothetical protein